MARCASHLVLMLLLMVPADVATQEDPLAGGLYRYGHIYWTSTGNVVNFVLELAFKRTVDTAYFHGSGPDGFAQTGDVVTLFGRENPEFDFGDSKISRLLKMTVTSYSIQEDWILGEVRIPHEYPSPTNEGAAWVARFSGCCRISSLQNNANSPYLLSAEINLNTATASPRAVILPEVSVVATFDGVDTSSFYIPGYSPDKKAAVQWYQDVPFKVGDAMWLSGGSTLSVPLQPFTAGADLSGYQASCARRVGGNGQASSVAPPCFFELLRMSPPGAPGAAAAEAGSPALTVEGWVRLSEVQGGVLLSTGSVAAPLGATATMDGSCVPGAAGFREACAIALLYIEVNRTHVRVGHERPVGAGGGVMLDTRSFGVASNADLVAQLTDTSIYSNGGSEQGLVSKWVHITVVRKMRWLGPSTFFGASYKVYVNGFPLELQQYTSLTPNAPAGCAADLTRYTPSRCGALYPLDGFDGGESDAIPAYGPADTAVWPTLGKYTALLFGAYNGTAGRAPAVDAQLDEWRFWNGARSAAATVASMNRALSPAAAEENGDPMATSGGRYAPVGLHNYLVESALLADYNFDADVSRLVKYVSGRSCPGPLLGQCSYIESLTPIYPGCAAGDTAAECPRAYNVDDDRFAGFSKAIYRAQAPGLCSDAAGVNYCVARTDTDNKGVVFYKDTPGIKVTGGTGLVVVNLPVAGRYQVTVRLALQGGVAAVPVDFIVVAVPNPSVVPVLSVFAPVRAGVYVGEAAAGDTLLPAPQYPDSMQVYAGFPVRPLLQGRSVTSAVGYTLGPPPATAEFSAARGVGNASSMLMRWTPCAGDVGVVTTCFDAVAYIRPGDSVGPSLARPVEDNSVSSDMFCLEMVVVPDPPPVFTNLTPPAATFTIGRAGSFGVYAEDDNCQDSVALAAVPPAATPAAAALPEGAVLGAPAAYQSTRNAYCANAIVRTLSWTPPPHYGGFSRDVCFSATDTHGVSNGGACGAAMVPHVTIRCVTVTVARCKYALKKDQHLDQIGKIFGLDWQLLWSLNPSIRHPDFFVHSGQTLNIGHLYRAGPNEVAAAVAARMGMPPGQLLLLNWDLGAAAGGSDGGALAEGQTICVVPSPCTAPKTSSLYDGLAYVAGRFVSNASDPSSW